MAVDIYRWGFTYDLGELLRFACDLAKLSHKLNVALIEQGS